MPSLRVLVFPLAAALSVSLCAPAADAAVQHRASACIQLTTANDTDTLTVAKPAGTAAGDVLVASLGSFDSDANPAPPSGWTAAGASSASDGTWYRVAGASEPAGYTFATPDGDTVAIAISAFTGVNTTTPLAGPATITSGSGTSFTLPNGTSVRAGSMRYSMTSTSQSGSGAPSTTFGAGLTEECDLFGESASVATAWEPVGAGATPNRAATLSASRAWQANTLVLNNAEACSTGGLNLSITGAIDFGAVTLNGVDRTANAALSLRADDQTGTLAGWRLSASATQFTAGTATLPTTAAEVTGMTPTAAPGRCSAPTNSVGSYPITLSQVGSVLFTAAAGTGSGPTDLGLAARLRVPSRSRTGAYTSTWTLTLASGP